MLTCLILRHLYFFELEKSKTLYDPSDALATSAPPIRCEQYRYDEEHG